MTLPDVAVALAEAASAINSARTLAETLDTIARVAQQSLDGVDHVGVSVLHRDGTIETVSATDQLVWELDSLQYQLREGPCVASLTRESVVTLTARETRWPRYVPEAVRRGVRAQIGVRLHHGGDTLGGLNLYSTSVEELPEDTVRTAQLFATHAALALTRARTEEQLNFTIASRQVIGQAVGILMERHRMSEARAFQFLARASQTSNIKIRDLAQELVDTAEEHHTGSSGDRVAGT
jgi:GAF domain-containing protein